MPGTIAGPRGEIRMATSTQAAVQVGRILAGEIEEEYEGGAPTMGEHRSQRVMRTFDANDPESVRTFAQGVQNVQGVKTVRKIKKTKD